MQKIPTEEYIPTGAKNIGFFPSANPQKAMIILASKYI